MNDAALTYYGGKLDDILSTDASREPEILMDFSLSDDLVELKERTERFVRDKILPFEADPRQTAHGPSEDLRRELVALGREAGLLSPHVGRDWGGLGQSLDFVPRFDVKEAKDAYVINADLPGVNLTFSATPKPVAGTKGRILDHIGFEVKDLERFCKKLEARSYKRNVLSD